MFDQFCFDFIAIVFSIFFFQNAKVSGCEIRGDSKEVPFGGGGDEEKRKIPWVAWDDICKSKNGGGLGVKNLKFFNEALFGKWRWNLFHQEGGLWREVFISKYRGWQELVRERGLSNESLW